MYRRGKAGGRCLSGEGTPERGSGGLRKRTLGMEDQDTWMEAALVLYKTNFRK
jgi:hypothetical protein